MNIKEIDCVLLVDDSLSTNFYHKKIIEVSGKINEIYQVENGLEALDFILKKGKFKNTSSKPNIIFLDINMPVMNGFEFLEEYAKIDEKSKENIMIVVVTTSNRIKDKERVSKTNLVSDIIEKPLTKENLKKISTLYSINY